MGHSFILALMTVVLLITTSAPARSTTVTVPDDFPTIQLALDSHADTVRIRAGNYAERPTMNPEFDRLVIEGIPASGQRPRMAGLIIRNFIDLIVSGCAFTGSVDLYPGRSSVDRVSFDSCDLDSGFVHHPDPPDDLARVMIVRSRIRGPVQFATYCEADTFESAGVVFDQRESASAINCIFIGPGTTAMRLHNIEGSTGRAIGNSIHGYSTGISTAGSDAQITLDGNRIENCSQGISASDEFTYVRNNLILNCESGITTYGDVLVSDNVVLGSTGTGIFLEADSQQNPSLLRNVVGRSGGAGIQLRLNSSGATIHRNTSFRNMGAGFLVRFESGVHELDLRNNIGFENGTYGVDVDTTAIAGTCNDWYGNTAGATRGLAPSGTDLAVDPLFCNVHTDSVALSAKSPLLDAAGCGLIGARGVGCATTPTLVSLFTASRDAEGVRVRWRFAESSRFPEVWVERADAQASPWKRIAMEREVESDLYVALDRDASASREYWYRLIAREGSETFVIGEPLKVDADVASQFELVKVAPNPGSGPLRISFTLAHEAPVEVDVFDVQGRHLASLVRGSLAPGGHVVEWSGLAGKRAGTSGLHLVRYRYPGGQQVLRFVRVR